MEKGIAAYSLLMLVIIIAAVVGGIFLLHLFVCTNPATCKFSVALLILNTVDSILDALSSVFGFGSSGSFRLPSLGPL